MNRRHRARVLACLGLVALAVSGCSEKPIPQVVVWDFSKGLTVRRAALTAIVVPPGLPPLAIGYDRPEGRVANTPLSFQLISGAWVPLPLPAAASGTSTVINAAALAADGSVWACGRTADYELEPSLILPVLYRFQGGIWTEVAITGGGDLSGIDARAIVTRGSGAGIVVRLACSATYGSSGAVLTYSGGQWSRDSLPAPSTAGAWDLSAIAQAGDGSWYAAGGLSGPNGGVIYHDRTGTGWRRVASPTGYPDLRYSALAFDPEGYAWLAGNYSAGDFLQGVLFRGSGEAFAPANIARHSGGEYQIYCIQFDRTGRGWLGGGRTGPIPFIAGTTGHGWEERPTQIEPGELSGSETFITGNTFHGVWSGGEALGFAVGYAEVLDFEGLSENECFIYELIPRPVGEIDAQAPITSPQRILGPGPGTPVGSRLSR